MKNISSIKNLSVNEINSLIDKLNNIKEEKNKIIEYVEKIKQDAEKNNISINDIINVLSLENSNKKRVKKEKYKLIIDGKEKKLTVRGVKPKWFTEYIEAGGNIKEIEFNE